MDGPHGAIYPARSIDVVRHNLLVNENRSVTQFFFELYIYFIQDIIQIKSPSIVSVDLKYSFILLSILPSNPYFSFTASVQKHAGDSGRKTFGLLQVDLI